MGTFIAISFGAKKIPFQVILDSMFHYEEQLDMQLVRDVRIPRVITGALVGGILAVSGAMMQGVTRNPVAEPSLMGVSQGAMLCIAISKAVPSLFGSDMIAAFVGAILSGFLVLLFSFQNARNLNISKLLLAGTALSTFFTSLASIIALLTNQSQNLAFWVAGGLRNVAWSSVSLVGSVGTICLIGSFLLAKSISIVNLGEDVAIGLGEKPSRVRIYAFLLMIPMCAVSVAVAGNIAFVGLIIPHFVRLVVGTDYRVLLPVSFVAGATLLIWSDAAARLVNQPYETPVGLFTSLIGVPIFLYMVRKESK